MLVYLISFLIMVYALLNFKRAFLYFLLFKTILVQNFTFFSVPNLPLLTVDTFMSLFFCGLFVCNYRKYKKLELSSFPMKMPFIVLSISMFLSAVFAIAGFNAAISQFVGESIQYVLAFIMWKLICSRRDILFLLNGIIILFIGYALYMFYEYSIQNNPFIEYAQSFVSSDRVIDFQYEITDERGYRAQAVFDHAIGGGCNFVLVGCFIFSLYYSYRVKLDNVKLGFICAILCTICTFLTGSRGPVFFMLIAYWGIVNIKNSKVYKLVAAALIILLVVIPFLPPMIRNIVMSIFDSSYQQKTGGSDANTRMEQLTTSIAVMQESPVFGLGQKFLSVYKSNLAQYLLGMESMWFKILTTYGLVGVATNVFSAYYFLVKIPKHYHSAPFFFISLAYWVTNSLTSLPGFLYYLYYLVLIILLKLALPQSSDRMNLKVVGHSCKY